MNYPKRIRDLREDADKTQTDVAKLLGIRQNVYSRYEVGANEIPIRHLIKLAQIYNVTTDYILGLTDDPTPPKRNGNSRQKEINSNFLAKE